MTKVNAPKRNHHILPKLYLKGFIEDKKNPFVWVYKKGNSYKPGSKSHHNPQRMSIRKAGAERDHYAFKMRDGSVEFEKYENELEKLEKPSVQILRKLRSQKMLSKQEKEIFANYIFHMFRRVSKHTNRFEEGWPEIYASLSSDIKNWLDFEDNRTNKDDFPRMAKIKNLRNEAMDILEFYRENFLKSEIPLITMVKDSLIGIPQMLSAMTWCFYKAPTGYGYIAGDNPIFNSGINKSFTEISFPIAKDVVLIMSWYKIKEGFFEATPDMVSEINRRTSNNAQREVYYSSAESSIVDLFKEEREGYYLIFPYSASMFR